MTVSAIYSPLSFPGAGVIAPLPITWDFGEYSEVVVVEKDDVTLAEVLRTAGVHYTIVRTVGSVGGVITPLAAIQSGKTWIVRRVTPRTQPNSLRLGGSFSEETVEGMFDRGVRMMQEVEQESSAGDELLRGDLSSADPLKGDALVTVTQPLTGAVQRGQHEKNAEQISVEDFGAVGDGVADDTAAIQAAENAVAAAGGTELLFKSTRYKITATLTKRASNVLWRGRGEGHQHDAGTGIDAGTAILWAGAEGEAMIDFSPTPGASNRRISGGGIVGIGLYGYEIAARGLDMRSVNNAKIDIYAEGFTDDCMYMGVVATLGEAKDTQQNQVRLLFSQVGANSGRGLVLDGDSAANTSCNKIHLRGAYKFAAALYLVNCDNNEIYQWTFRFGGGTALGVDSLGAASAAVAARANTWSYIYAGDGGVRLRGTGDGYAVASTRNRFLMWDNDNSQPLPVVGTGCDYFMADHDGRLRWTEVFAYRPVANLIDWHTGTDANIANNPRLFRMQFSGTAAGFLALTHDATPNIILRAQGDVAANVGMALVTKGTGRGILYGADFASAALQWEHTGGVSKIGFQGTAPIAKPTLPAAATDAATTQALANAIRTLLINYGLAS